MGVLITLMKYHSILVCFFNLLKEIEKMLVYLGRMPSK